MRQRSIGSESVVFCKGFTLIELLMVIAVIGILSAIALPVYSSYTEKARASAAVLGIGVIQRAIAAYYVESNDYPSNLAGIGMDGMKDPWGHPYQYLKIAGPTNGNSGSNQANGNGNGGTSGGGTASKNKATGNKGGVDAGGIGTSGGASTGGTSGGGTSGNNEGGGSSPTPRKDHNLVPINTDYDLYSMGPDGQSVAPLTAKASRDDIIRGADGAFIGRASDF